MKVVLQRVLEASVTVDKKQIGAIQQGFLLLVGVGQDDTIEDVQYVARKISQLRVFEDAEGKMNKNIQDVAGSILSISQFTLYANTKKGNRPSFVEAAKPEIANQLYEQFNEELRQLGMTVETGQFGADMKISLINDGPVTILFDSKKNKKECL